MLIDGTLLDLSDVTEDLRRRRDDTGHSLDWILRGHTSVDQLIPFGVSPGRLVVAVWLSDDPGDGDGEPLTDSNARLVGYAAAFGRTGAHRSVRAVIHRPLGGEVQALSWRVVR